jgi:hypothetical protein
MCVVFSFLIAVADNTAGTGSWVTPLRAEHAITLGKSLIDRAGLSNLVPTMCCQKQPESRASYRFCHSSNCRYFIHPIDTKKK